MAQLSNPQPHELRDIIRILEEQLEKLDIIGAGLAAIHVNAAIEQLRVNLSALNEHGFGTFDPNLLCLTVNESQLN